MNPAYFTHSLWQVKRDMRHVSDHLQVQPIPFSIVASSLREKDAEMSKGGIWEKQGIKRGLELLAAALLFTLFAAGLRILLTEYGPTTPEGTARLHQSILAAYLTLLGFLLIINFAVAASLKRSTYLYYAAFLLFHGFTTAYYEGWLHFDQKEDAGLDELFLLSVPLSIIALLLFTKNFLALKKHDLLTNRLTNILTIIWIMLLGQAFLVNLPEALEIVSDVQRILAPITGFFLIAAGWRAWMRKQEEARFFVLAFWIHLIALIIFLTFGQSDEPGNRFAYYQLLLGSTFEISLLSIALIDLLRRTLLERNRAQEEAIENLQRAQEVEAQYTQRLERDVETRTRELASVSAHKDQLLSILAHDLRSPLNSINQVCEYSIRREKSTDVDSYRDTLETILDCGKELYALLENLLCWAQWQQEEITLEPTWVAPVDLLNETATLFRFQAERHQLKLFIECPKDGAIYTDPQMVKVILRNLVSNALAYTEPGGTIIIRFQQEDVNACFSVTDTGAGMPPEVVQRLIETDLPISRGSKSESGGLGLGLVICRTLSRKLEGQLIIESELGKGTTVALKVPVKTDQD
ncbi:sensor histidine kinase [Rubellicoccus peritrichatus]|uniref:histidine kinase n=1 Tax=Rubellicoccus peritrichatus TaxID=3080537 RepID=A0AAQ3L590_9BACT|nr:sensor histidine kinase [Puniceicoccus sp. CR14]WOO39395.1 sensor histidine kinase [Puniceicoccus sp. CR14]